MAAGPSASRHGVTDAIFPSTIRILWSVRTLAAAGSMRRPARTSIVSAVAAPPNSNAAPAIRQFRIVRIAPSPANVALGRCNVSGAGAGVLARIGPLVEHLVDQAESLGLVGLEELIAVHGLFDLLDL